MKKFKKILKNWLKYLSMSPEERYLSKSVDMVDLERRQQYLRINRYL